jgi:hypothetical protein
MYTSLRVNIKNKNNGRQKMNAKKQPIRTDFLVTIFLKVTGKNTAKNLSVVIIIGIMPLIL